MSMIDQPNHMLAQGLLVFENASGIPELHHFLVMLH